MESKLDMFKLCGSWIFTNSDLAELWIEYASILRILNVHIPQGLSKSMTRVAF
jgi:hypothetical protein